ncbi:MAG: cysteine--tRNA ligase [Phycisphaerales bacterium]|nr:cysteine--tRNA ligase [Phycisphaerales bacterium]
MTIHLHNTMSGQTEPFVPIDPNGPVRFYTCGPTVYDYAHIGNFRAFLASDVLRRVLELAGHDVRHIMNITDVGHMSDDTNADGGGEDKMQVAARRLLEAKKSGALPDGVDIDPDDPMAIADFYAEAFLEDARLLGLKVADEVADDPSLMPRPSQFVQGMIDMVQTLIDRGHAYVADDGVAYFDVQSFPDYGSLSGNKLDAIRSGEGGRVDMGTQAIKRHPADFMLWKPDASHLMRWASPWGEGYPGWHLECSVMARALLGDEIDLHSGGEDNIFPHHECEIAQTRGVTMCDSFARTWVHVRHLMVDGGKMSKSAGTFFTVRDLLVKGATPAAIRLELIRTHYRVNANFTMQGLRDCGRMVDRWCRLQDALVAGTCDAHDGAGPLERALADFKAALFDDLNLAKAIGVLNEAAAGHSGATGNCAASAARELDALKTMDQVLGVLDRNSATVQPASSDEAEIDALVAARNAARANKDWAEADRVRDELLDMGIEIKDGADGTSWRRIVQ